MKKLSEEERKLRTKEHKKKWFAKNPGYLAEWKRRNRLENPEKAREIDRRKYYKNADKIRERHRVWFRANQETQKSRMAQWKYKNSEMYALKILSRALDKDQISQEMIDAKVQHLKVMWLIKGVSHEVIERHQDRHE